MGFISSRHEMVAVVKYIHLGNGSVGAICRYFVSVIWSDGRVSVTSYYVL